VFAIKNRPGADGAFWDEPLDSVKLPKNCGSFYPILAGRSKLIFSPAIGLVGPMSNPPQLVETVPYRVGPMKGSRFHGNLRSSEVPVNVDEVQTFAKEFRESHKGSWVPVDRLGGFC
jgi:hypothetical protein